MRDSDLSANLLTVERLPPSPAVKQTPQFCFFLGTVDPSYDPVEARSELLRRRLRSPKSAVLVGVRAETETTLTPGQTRSRLSSDLLRPVANDFKRERHKRLTDRPKRLRQAEFATFPCTSFAGHISQAEFFTSLVLVSRGGSLEGLHPRTVTEIFGHSDIGLTLRTYGHVVPDLMREAAEKIGAALGGR